MANAVPAPMAAPDRPGGMVAPGQPALDEFSQKGQFGWDKVGKTHLPYILRHPEEKYCAVRMVESHLLSKFPNFPIAEIYSTTCIDSFYITEAEATLLNNINYEHCAMAFGRKTFITKDLVVKLKDVHEFYNFLKVCYSKLRRVGFAKQKKCGLIRINNKSAVPYIVKNDNKFLPLFYFEGDTDGLKLKAEKLEDWDWAYLKFCCKVQGISNDLIMSQMCYVVRFSDIKKKFPTGTLFEDYWPIKVVDSQLFKMRPVVTGNKASWIKAPPAMAVPPAPTSVTVNKVIPSPTPHTARTAAMPQTPSQAQQQPGLGGQATNQPTGLSPQQAQQARMTHTDMAAMQQSMDKLPPKRGRKKKKLFFNFHLKKQIPVVNASDRA